MRTLYLVFVVILSVSCVGYAVTQSGEFRQPWKNSETAIVLDPYSGNSIDWEKLATDKRVVGIIHKATEGSAKDKEYAARKLEAKRRGYLWGSYHLAKPGDPIAQADFYIQTVSPGNDEVIALDVESLNPQKNISIDDARKFVVRIKERIGRSPLLYANHGVVKELSAKISKDDVLAKTPLWYARFKGTVTDFPKAIWGTYTLWQFSCEINCTPAQKGSCLYLVPGTKTDMDVNVFNGTIAEIKTKWPFNN